MYIYLCIYKYKVINTQNIYLQKSVGCMCLEKFPSIILSPYQVSPHPLAILSHVAILQLPPKTMYHPHKNLLPLLSLYINLLLPSCYDISCCNPPVIACTATLHCKLWCHSLLVWSFPFLSPWYLKQLKNCWSLHEKTDWIPPTLSCSSNEYYIPNDVF